MWAGEGSGADFLTAVAASCACSKAEDGNLYQENWTPFRL